MRRSGNFLHRMFALGLCVCTTLVASCATTAGRGYPKLDESKLVDAFAVVQLQEGRYLEQFPDCNKPIEKDGWITICIDSAPFELQATVIQQLTGPRLPHTVVFASTSHYGIPR